MKTLILSIATLISFSSFAQVNLQQGNSTLGMLTFSKRDYDKSENIAGKQYINDKFASAYVNSGTTPFQIRFNPNTNLMEYDNDGETIILEKDANTEVKFLGNNGKKYVLVDSSVKEISGKTYMRVLFETEGFAFLNYEKINLKAAQYATNSYETDSPAEFIRAKDEFYISLNGKVVSSLSKVKDVTKAFPSQEKQIKDFVKSNKIDFSKERDITRLGSFIAGNK